jgi:hypothetical protein
MGEWSNTSIKFLSTALEGVWSVLHPADLSPEREMVGESQSPSGRFGKEKISKL